MSSLSEGDILGVMRRRVYDIAGCNEDVKVFLNGNLLPNTFEQYLNVYNMASSEIESHKVIQRFM